MHTLIWSRALICALLLPVIASAQDDAALVRVDAVVTEPLVQTVPVLGRLVATQSGKISARIDGPVGHVFVKIGERVSEGQIIARLETGTLEAQQALVEARLAESRALLTTREAELELARQEVQRLKAIKNPAVTSRAVIDDAVQNLVIAEARVGQALAAVDSAVAGKTLADLNLDHALVRAPYSGVIVRRATEDGEFIKSGQDVAEIIADHSLEVEADIPFDRLSGLDKDTMVRMVLDDGGEHTAQLRVIVPREDRLTRTRTARFVPEFGDDAGILAVDQSVTLYIPQGAARSVLTVHKDAVIRQQDRQLVYVVQDGVAKMRSVQLGHAVGSRLEVLGGLVQGEEVVVRGNERLHPDAPVTVDREPS